MDNVLDSSMSTSYEASVTICEGDFFKTYGLKHIRVAGKGLTSIVILSKPLDGGALRAVKLLSKEERFGGKKSKGYFETEAKILQNIQHKHIVEIFEACDCPDMYVISMPYYQRGSLISQLPKMTSQLTEKYMLELTSAVSYLHGHKIAHRDIKPGNILISVEGDAILSDFGLACIVESKQMPLTQRVGTIAYAPPEIIRGDWNDQINFYKCDTYSLGMAIWCMVVREEAKPGQTNHMNTIQQQRENIKDYRYLLEHLLEHDTNKRWDTNQLVSELCQTRSTMGHDLTRYFNQDTPVPLASEVQMDELSQANKTLELENSSSPETVSDHIT